MQTIKKLILWLAFFLACCLPASALTLTAPENRVGKNLTSTSETHQPATPQVPQSHQEEAGATARNVSECFLAGKVVEEVNIASNASKSENELNGLNQTLKDNTESTAKDASGDTARGQEASDSSKADSSGDTAQNSTPKETDSPQPVDKAQQECQPDQGSCFVAGTLVAEDAAEKPIEQIHVGDRVLSTTAKEQSSATDVDSKTWKKLKLHIDSSTDPVDIELVRSPQWIHDEQAEVGKKIWFEWKDIGLSGWATVTDIGRAPPLQGGKGRVVTSTITHHNSDVYKLAISGSDAPLEVTGVHLVYSATRHDFVRARDLKVGEELLTHSGAECHIKSILHESGTHRVYNFEVEHDHHYYVGDEQVLVHNSCGKNFDQARTEAFDKAGMTNPDTVTFSKVDPQTGTVVEFKGPKGSKVAYDGSHESSGPAHDQPHVGYQSAGKRTAGGADRGNIPYDGPQHPSRSPVKGVGVIDYGE